MPLLPVVLSSSSSLFLSLFLSHLTFSLHSSLHSSSFNDPIPSSLFTHISPFSYLIHELVLDDLLSSPPSPRIMDSDGILRIVESGLNHYPVIKNEMTSPSYSENCINLCLQDEDLWRKFNSVANEMIVTKGGR